MNCCVHTFFSRKESELSSRLLGYPAVFVIADRNVRRFIAEPLVELMAEEGVALRGVRYIRTSERRKSLGTVESLVKWLVGAGADRDALLVAIGGGITTDIVGFTASIFKRGVRYVNVPTTLLAQVDASVGGKTGCNIAGYKNMVGTITQPEFTFINVNYLKTLSWEQFSAGYAELLKTFLIADEVAYEDAVALDDYDKIEPLVRAAVKIKSEIVEKDEKETGARKVLNLGHTFAHAIEYKASHSLFYRLFHGNISHGHAVAMGIIMSARLSEKRKVASRHLAERLEADFERIGLPVESPWTEEELFPIMKTDKKSFGGELHFVLIKKPGEVTVQ